MTKIDGQEVEIEDIRDDWALALMEQGVIVRLTLKRWRATSKLDFEELGIVFSDEESQEFMNKYIQLGHEKLLPPSVMREIATIEHRARMNLGSFSYQTIWGKFVPFSSFTEWKIENEEIKKDYMELSKSIGDRYDHIISVVKDEYSKMGTDVWQRANSSTGVPPASFLEHFTSRIIDKIPDRDKIVSSFSYDAIFFSIPLPSAIEEDILKAEKVIMDREIQIREHELALESKVVIAEEYRSRKRELIEEFLESTVNCLRSHVSELANHIYDVLQRNERDISLTHVKKIKRLIEKVKSLNFHNDKGMNEILTDLEVEIDKYKGERDKNAISHKLKALVDLAKEDYTPEEFNPMFGIVDID